MYIIRLFLIFLCVFLTDKSYAQDIKISVQMNSSQTSTGELEGIILIRHQPSQIVNIDSFKMKGRPLNVESLPQETKATNEPIVSVQHAQETSSYRFKYPVIAGGLQLLPAISVEIGGKVYQSSPLTFSVTQLLAEAPLQLSARVIPSAPYYPGQRLQLLYRIAYKGTVELTKEQLPLLHLKDFKKLGDIHVKEYVEGAYSMQEIIQEAETVNSGVFVVPASLIEGDLYTHSPGKAEPVKIKIRSQSPSFEITVSPFPKEGKPAAFNGALGVFNLSVTKTSSDVVNLGDEMTFNFVFKGQGEWETVNLPAILCQPGFSGFFALDELPPGEKEEENIKTFKVKLRPMTTFIDALPSVEFVSYDPQIGHYHISRTEPIPFKITPLATTYEQRQAYDIKKKRLKDDTDEDQTNWKQVLSSIPIPLIPPLTLAKDKSGAELLTFNRFLSLALICLILLMLLKLFQWVWRRLPKAHIEQPSKEQLNKAFLTDLSLSSRFEALKNALLTRLYEVGLSKISANAYEELSLDGAQGKVRRFLEKLDASQYLSSSTSDENSLLKEGRTLYEQLEKEERHA